jgi:hypothetical protein
MSHEVEGGIWLAKANADIPNLFRRFNTEGQRGNYELYCREFSYATILGNLRTGNLPIILKLLEISQLPNIMFLIQSDACRTADPEYPDCSQNQHKTGIVPVVQDRLRRLRIEHVVSRFLGHGAIGAYLCLEGKSVFDADTRLSVGALAADLAGYVREKTDESVSIGVSDFCGAFTDFPKAYAECKAALSRAFYSGAGTIAVYEKRADPPGIARLDITQTCFTGLITLLDKCDAESCRAVIEDMAERLRRAGIAPIVARLHAAGLVGRLTDYYVAAGLDPDALEQVSREAMIQLLNCGFLNELTGILAALCEHIGRLHSGARQSPDEQFRRHANDCIEKYSGDCLFGLSAIAAFSNYRPSYISRLFTRNYGIPFRR